MVAPLVGAGLVAGGNLLGAVTGAGAARRQNRELAAGQREQNRAGMESSNVVASFIDQLRGSRPNPGAERGAFTAALGGPAVSGPGGARFKADAAGATGAARGYGGMLADTFSRVRAPQLQQQRESELLLDMSNQLRPIQQRSQNDQFLTQLRAGMKQPNPWMNLLAGGLTGAGSYLLANGGRKPPLGGAGPATGMGANVGGNWSDLLTSGVAV